MHAHHYVTDTCTYMYTHTTSTQTRDAHIVTHIHVYRQTDKLLYTIHIHAASYMYKPKHSYAHIQTYGSLLYIHTL